MIENRIRLSCLVVVAAALWPVSTALAAAQAQELADKSGPAAGPTEAQTKQSSAAPVRRSHLRFKSVDGSCSCTCASGGTSEQAIQQAHDDRQRNPN